MAGRPPRSKPFSWPSRPRWRPATPNTNPARAPHSAALGWSRLLLSSAAVTQSRRWSPPRSRRQQLPPGWRMPAGSARPADRIVAVMEQSRSTWQLWHVRAEAQRQVRTIDLPVDQSNRLVDLLVFEVLQHRSVALKAPPDGIEEPDALRRADGSSVYAIAGADRYTSHRILDAEQRILTAAGRHDGAAVNPSAVELALLEMAANGTALDAGQAALVRQMCTSGGRVELAIAPAGAGKTTAMRALTLAWTEDGGQVIGLAPSAAAAAVLAEHTGIQADTLAKLTWGLQHNDLPNWAAHIDRRTLMIIDAQGVSADTMHGQLTGQESRQQLYTMLTRGRHANHLY